MAIRREVVYSHQFHAPASEDLFFTLDLLLDGARCRHVDSARLRSLGASTWGTSAAKRSAMKRDAWPPHEHSSHA